MRLMSLILRENPGSMRLSVALILRENPGSMRLRVPLTQGRTRVVCVSLSLSQSKEKGGLFAHHYSLLSPKDGTRTVHLRTVHTHREAYREAYRVYTTYKEGPGRHIEGYTSLYTPWEAYMRGILPYTHPGRHIYQVMPSYTQGGIYTRLYP